MASCFCSRQPTLRHDVLGNKFPQGFALLIKKMLTVPRLSLLPHSEPLFFHLNPPSQSRCLFDLFFLNKSLINEC